MRKSTLACAALAIAFAFSGSIAAADEGGISKPDWFPGSLSGNVSIYTDYSFRGVSQTSREMAVQGGLDWSHDSGIHFGTWGSNTNFGNTYLEDDLYGGYAGSFGDFSYDVLATFFYYPNDEQFNYWEFAAKTGYDFGFMSTNLGFIGSPDYFGTLDTGFYIPFGFAVPIPIDAVKDYFTLSADANAGYTHTDRLIFEDHHYWDWNAGLVVSLPVNLSFNFRYVDTDVKDVQDAGARFIFGTTYAF